MRVALLSKYCYEHLDSQYKQDAEAPFLKDDNILDSINAIEPFRCKNNLEMALEELRKYNTKDDKLIKKCSPEIIELPF